MHRVPADSALCSKGEMFELLASSVIGASHIRKKQVCQDSVICSHMFFRGEEIVVAIVADGHGSEKYIYSDIGSKLAVEAAHAKLTAFSKWIIEERLTSREARHYFKGQLIKDILQMWHQKLAEDYEDRKEEEEQSFQEIVKLYGTTLSFVLICRGNIYSGQIGDGAIYHLEYGVNVKLLLPNIDSENFGLTTDSLCNEMAIYKYQSEIISLSKRKQGVLLLSTDGLLDSLDDNIVAMLQDLSMKKNRFGLENLRQIWPKMLRRWTEDGVGDDMGTILLFYGKQQNRSKLNYILNKQVSKRVLV